MRGGAGSSPANGASVTRRPRAAPGAGPPKRALTAWMLAASAMAQPDDLARDFEKLSAKDAFDVLYAEGDARGLDAPKMMSVGLHCRIVGKPGRAAALARFLDYVQKHEDVWVTRRIDIARHWLATHPYAEIDA